MSFSRNIWWNLAYPLTVNRIRLSAPLTVIWWHLRLGRRLGAFQIHTIRWRHSRLAPLTVTVTVSVAFRNVSINRDFLCRKAHVNNAMKKCLRVIMLKSKWHWQVCEISSTTIYKWYWQKYQRKNVYVLILRVCWICQDKGPAIVSSIR